MNGDPKLTQRKIDKLRDALNVVVETDQVNPDDSDPRALQVFERILRARAIPGMLEGLLERR